MANAVATTVCVKEEELRRAVEALQGQLKEQQRVFQTRLQRIQAKQKSDMKEFKDLKKSQHTTATALANAKDEALVKEKQYVTPALRRLVFCTAFESGIEPRGFLRRVLTPALVAFFLVVLCVLC